MRVAYLSTYPPRRCGIAEFTRDLRDAVGVDGPVLALDRFESDADPTIRYPHDVMPISDQDPAAYRHAADVITTRNVDVVSLQHEFGIFGGPDGALVTDFLDAVRSPVVATLHTVLRTPTPWQRAIIEEIGRRAAAVVVMSRSAARLLSETYRIEAPIKVIPHGVPARVDRDRDFLKGRLGLGGRKVALNFGLVGPGKGLELAIEALGEVRRSVPHALFVILGATHPDLVAREGEAYRQSLKQLSADLGVEDAVRFEDRFVDERELGDWLAASDVFITPYPNLEQIVSGTLAFALGAGRAIVSTPYDYAKEMLGQGRGLLVPPASSGAMAKAVSDVLSDRSLQASLEAGALELGDRMRWPRIGMLYEQLFQSVATPFEMVRADARTETVRA